MLKIISVGLIIFLFGGLLSIIPDLQNSKFSNNETSSDGNNNAAYSDWTIKKIDSLSAEVNEVFAVNYRLR